MESNVQYLPMIPTNQKRLDWCSIVFFEYNKRINNCTISSKQEIISIRNQNPKVTIEDKNGEIFIFIQSTSRVFIQCAFLNWINKMDVKSVIELNPSVRMIRIFDENLFKQLIFTNSQRSYEALSSLIMFTKFTIAFTSDWSKQIKKIDELINSPCRFEFSITRALIELDEPLKQLGSSKQQVTSVS